MRKSPGKWFKTVLFGKKSSKSNLSKDTTTEKKASITKTESRDLDEDSLVISNPVPQTIDTSGANTESEKGSTANLSCNAVADGRGTMVLSSENDAEFSRLEQAATKAQAAFRGYLARRAFWALKGIIRLQALVRGHLVRRQGIATLRCMRAIVEFQAVVRGRKVRLAVVGHQVLETYKSAKPGVKPLDLLGTSLKSEKLSRNAFGTKLLASSPATMPLSIQYDPVEPNSAWNWLERWSSSCFWEPLEQPRKMPDAKPKRKQAKLQTEETEAGRPKRSVRRIPAVNGDSHPLHSSENEKPKRNARKVLSHQSELVQESPNELEKVKRNLRKTSVSNNVASEKSEPATDKAQTNLGKVSVSPTHDVSEQGIGQTFEKLNDSSVAVSKQPEPEALPIPPAEEQPLDVLHDEHPVTEPTSVNVENGATVNEERNRKDDQPSKENQKTRRRKSFPAKQEFQESVSQNSPTLPSYMAATESAKAKLRAQGSPSPWTGEDTAENGFVRQHSLPSSTNLKVSLQSPRIQKPLQANGKGGTKSNKSLTSSRDEKLQTGWKR